MNNNTPRNNSSASVSSSSTGLLSRAKGALISNLLPGGALLGTKLGDWYERNPYHKYGSGEVLVLNNRRSFGFGIRPVGVVDRYEMVEDGNGGRVGRYFMNMYRDSGDFAYWLKHNKLPEDAVSIPMTTEAHFKWNIENLFHSLRNATIEEARASYSTLIR